MKGFPISRIQPGPMTHKSRLLRLAGLSEQPFDRLRPGSLTATVRANQIRNVIKQNLIATIPCTTTLAVAFYVSFGLDAGPQLRLAIAVRALCFAAFMLVLRQSLARLEQGRFTSRDEHALGLGSFLSSLLWGTLIWPLESTLALDMWQLVIITISLVSIVVTMLIAAHHFLTLRMAALGGIVGVTLGMTDAHPLALPILSTGVATLILTIWAYAVRLHREARRGIILNMRMEMLSRRLARTNGALEEALAQARWLANHDSLTQLRNRRAVGEKIAMMPATVGHQAHVLMLLDIDHFKSINDRFGHDIGDSVLLTIGTALRQWEADGANRLTGRWGGEEFIALITPQNGEHAETIAEDLRHRISQLGSELPWPASLSLTTSIGCARFCVQDQFEEALNQADQALYAAKISGRNCWRLAA